MANRHDGKNNRRFGRLHWRVPCSFRHDDSNRRGFVTDLSPSGLFVHTSAMLETGEAIRLTLDTHDYPPMRLSGIVVRSRRVHRNATTVHQTSGGIGIQLDSAPEEYYQLIADLGDKFNS